MMTHRCEDYTDVVITAEAFNCKGFGQFSEYIFDRLQACDFLGLTETWFRPHELHTISSSMQNHPKFKDSHMDYMIFSKSGMTDIEPDYTGRPFGGISCIFKNKPNLNVKGIEILSDRLIALGLYDMSDSLVQVICCVYMLLCDMGNKTSYLFMLKRLTCYSLFLVHMHTFFYKTLR